MPAKSYSKKFIPFVNAMTLLLVVLIVYSVFFFGAGWLHMYSTYRQEKIIANLYVSQKYVKDGKPTFKFTYTPTKENRSAFWTLFKGQIRAPVESASGELYGDKLYIEASFLKVSKHFKVFPTNTLYKIDGIRTGYFSGDTLLAIGEDVVEITAGPDTITPELTKNTNSYKYFIDDAFEYSYSVDVQPTDKVYNVIIRNDSIVLK